MLEILFSVYIYFYKTISQFESKNNHIFFSSSETIFYDAKDGFDIEVGKNVFIHKNYNTAVMPKYNLDVALIKLDRGIRLNKKLHTVCLWNSTYISMYSYLFQDVSSYFMTK